jgi:hypothetical protein
MVKKSEVDADLKQRSRTGDGCLKVLWVLQLGKGAEPTEASQEQSIDGAVLVLVLRKLHDGPNLLRHEIPDGDNILKLSCREGKGVCIGSWHRDPHR